MNHSQTDGEKTESYMEDSMGPMWKAWGTGILIPTMSEAQHITTQP